MGTSFHSFIAGRCYVASGSRVSRWCADDCQPVHSAGIALCLRSHRAAVYEKWLATVGGDGGDLRARRLIGGGGRRLGGASQSVRSLARVAVRGTVRADAAAASIGRAPDAPTGGGRQPTVGSRGRRCSSASRRFVPDRRRHGPALGTVCRADSRPVADRGGAARGKHRHHVAVAGLCRGCRHFPRRGVVAGR